MAPEENTGDLEELDSQDDQSTARRKQTATPKNQYFFGERIEWEPGRVIIRTWYL